MPCSLLALELASTKYKDNESILQIPLHSCSRLSTTAGEQLKLLSIKKTQQKVCLLVMRYSFKTPLDTLNSGQKKANEANAPLTDWMWWWTDDSRNNHLQHKNKQPGMISQRRACGQGMCLTPEDQRVLCVIWKTHDFSFPHTQIGSSCKAASTMLPCGGRGGRNQISQKMGNLRCMHWCTK